MVFFFYIFIGLPKEHKYKIVIPSAKRKVGCDDTLSNIFRLFAQYVLLHLYITLRNNPFDYISYIM